MEPIYRLPPDWSLEVAAIPLAEVIDPFQEFLGVADLQAKNAGKIGKRRLTYAVLDTGVDVDHKDLQGQILEAADFTRSISGPRDVNSHGCIAPTDKIYTSLCGVQDIQEVFKRSSGVTHFLPDGSTVIDVSRRAMHTLSLDAKGNTVRSQILCVQKLPYRGQVFRVDTGSGSLTLTPWHPVYVCASSRGKQLTIVKKRADELAVGDKVMLSSNNVGVSDAYLDIPIRQVWNCQFCGHAAAGGKRRQCRKCRRARWHTGASLLTVRLDEELAYLIGCIASDGHVAKKPRQYSVRFSNSNTKLHAHVAAIMRSRFGVAGRPRPPKDGTTCYDVEFDNREGWLAMLAAGLPAGKKSRILRVPELISKSPRSVIGAFLAGLIEGDGNVTKQPPDLEVDDEFDAPKLRISTGSVGFAQDLVLLCRTLGMHSSYSEVKPSKTGRVKTQNPSYSVCVAADPCITAALRCKTVVVGITWAPKRRLTSAIKKIETQHYDGHLYDLTVDKHHNYVANGHIVSNTWCVGAIAAAANDVGVRGIAYEGQVLSAKVLGDNGAGTETGILRGMQWAHSKGADVFSLSLGGPAMSDTLHATFREISQQKGKFIFCASGNDAGSVNYPAAWPDVIAVGAVDREGRRTKFTSHGPELDILAPGVDILGTVIGNRYGTMTGTSMATPIAAAIGGLVYAQAVNSNRGEQLDTLEEMLTLLKKTGRAGDSYPLIDPRTLAKQQGSQPVNGKRPPVEKIILYADGEAYTYAPLP